MHTKILYRNNLKPIRKYKIPARITGMYLNTGKSEIPADFIDIKKRELSIKKALEMLGDILLKTGDIFRKNSPAQFPDTKQPTTIVTGAAQKVINNEIQQELFEKETLFSSIIAASPDGIGMSDLNGNITLLSDALVNMYGATCGFFARIFS